jgi:hypothetical protein
MPVFEDETRPKGAATSAIVAQAQQILGSLPDQAVVAPLEKQGEAIWEILEPLGMPQE